MIELLVVVAVIAILASLLLPALAKAKQASQDGYCKNNQKQIATAVGMYCLDNQERLPMITQFGKAWVVQGESSLISSNPPDYPDHLRPLAYLPDMLFPYLGTNKCATDTLTPAQMANYRPTPGLYTCPSAITIQAPTSDLSDVDYGDEKFYADNDGVSYVWMAIYYNININDGWEGNDDFGHPVSGRKSSQIASPTKAVDVFEMPYHDWLYQPHFKGQNVCHPDGSVTRFKGYPAMTDWYFENSEYGWDISTASPNLH